MSSSDVPESVAANVASWTKANKEHTDAAARRHWAADEITWGVFNAPESELKALPSDLALVPRNGEAFVTIRVGDLADTKPGKDFLTQLRKEAGNVATELEKELGVSLTDIERLSYSLDELTKS